VKANIVKKHTNHVLHGLHASIVTITKHKIQTNFYCYQSVTVFPGIWYMHLNMFMTVILLLLSWI